MTVGNFIYCLVTMPLNKFLNFERSAFYRGSIRLIIFIIIITVNCDNRSRELSSLHTFFLIFQVILKEIYVVSE